MDYYVARQPIFARNKEVFAYELLYRSGRGNYYNELDGDKASSELISNSLLLFGLEKLTRGRRAFINFTTRLLESDVAELLPQDKVVVEVLESVEPKEDLIKACRKIKEAGYLLALDDFIYEEKFRPLLEITDIVKVDFLHTKGKERKEIMKRINFPGISYLAEKVETPEDFEEAMKLGYQFFQGFFFSKPVVISSKDIPTFKLNYMRVLQEVNKPDINFEQVEKLIKSDLALSYKLLKFINSAAFNFRSEISSIKQAITLLGQQEMIKWFSLLTLKDIGDDKPEELIVTAVCRAKFCELLAPQVGLKQQSSDLFLMGLFSLIDAFLDQPLADILEDLPLAQDVKNALNGEPGVMRDVYRLTLAYEKGKFEEAAAHAARLNLQDQNLVHVYMEALELGNQVFV